MDDEESSEDSMNFTKSLEKYGEDLMESEAFEETIRSNVFNTNDLCVIAGYIIYEERRLSKTVIKIAEDENMFFKSIEEEEQEEQNQYFVVKENRTTLATRDSQKDEE